MQIKSKKNSIDFRKIIVGVTGGSGSGKSTLCQNVKNLIKYNQEFDATMISLDCFYKNIGPEVDNRSYNWDHPDSLDFDTAYTCLLSLLEGKPTDIPIYSFTENKSVGYQLIQPTSLIFFEGLYALYDKRIRDLMAYKIFIHCESSVRLARRLLRDTEERGREVLSIIYQYNRFVKKAYEDFIHPTIIYADMIVPGSRNNMISVKFIVDYLKNAGTQMNIFKNIAEDNAYFFGDMLEYVDDFITSKHMNQEENNESQILDIKDFYNNKFLLYPFQQTTKRELEIIFQNFYIMFSLQKLKTLFKQLVKIQLEQFVRISSLFGIDKSQIEIQNINSFLKKETPIFQSKEYLVLLIPFVTYNHEDQIFEILDFYSQHFQKKIIIFNIFGQIKIFHKIQEQYQRKVVHVVNLYCISGLERFIELIKPFNQDNVDIINPFFLQDFLFDKLGKYLEAIQI